MVSAQARREQVAFVQSKGLSCRKACALLGVARSALQYKGRFEGKDKELVEKLRGISRKHPKYGYRFAWSKLRQDGVCANHKRVHRLWRKSALQVPVKKSRKRVRPAAYDPKQLTAINQVWSYDFVFDECANGQKLKCLTVIDEFSRECMSIKVEGRIRSKQVIEELGRLFSRYGAPLELKSDNGPEFVAKSVKKWLQEQGVSTRYIEPGKPWQNGKNESFNGHFRSECLDLEWFLSRAEAKVMIEEWRKEYNEERPHSSLKYETPASVGSRSKPAAIEAA
jgi:putative transposase